MTNTYPDKVAELLNHIINTNSISSIQWHNNDLKELLNILATKNNNLQELKCILEKLVPIGSQYNWRLNYWVNLIIQILSENLFARKLITKL